MAESSGKLLLMNCCRMARLSLRLMAAVVRRRRPEPMRVSFCFTLFSINATLPASCAATFWASDCSGAAGSSVSIGAAASPFSVGFASFSLSSAADVMANSVAAFCVTRPISDVVGSKPETKIWFRARTSRGAQCWLHVLTGMQQYNHSDVHTAGVFQGGGSRTLHSSKQASTPLIFVRVADQSGIVPPIDQTNMICFHLMSFGGTRTRTGKLCRFTPFRCHMSDLCASDSMFHSIAPRLVS
jgi:hypothetical protein